MSEHSPATQRPAEATPLRQRWQADTLAQRLQALLPGLVVEVLTSCPSTNTLLVERARCAGAGASWVPTLLVAEAQTQGRGRLGRSWVAAAGASLTFTLALPLAPRDWSGLSLAVGLALAEALAPGAAPGTPRIGLKWPNDLWLADAAHPAGGRKLGGILIETVGVGPARICVVGVGLNVRPLSPALAEGLGDNSAASLFELEPLVTAPQALAQVALPLAQALRGFEREGFAPLAARYSARDLLRGQRVRAALPRRANALAGGAADGVAGGTEGVAAAVAEGLAEGVAEGVDAQGALVLRLDSGCRERIVSGEVSVRRIAGAESGPLPVALVSNRVA